MKFREVYVYNDDFSLILEGLDKKTSKKQLAEHVFMLYHDNLIGDIDLSSFRRHPFKDFNFLKDEEVEEQIKTILYANVIIRHNKFGDDAEVNELLMDAGTVRDKAITKLAYSLYQLEGFLERYFLENDIGLDFIDTMSAYNYYLRYIEKIDYYTFMGWFILLYILKGDEKRCQIFLDSI